MENQVLIRHGLYMDEMTRKIRLLNPDYHQLTNDLVAECLEYIRGAKDFKVSAGKQVGILMKLKKITERQKHEVIAKRSQLLALDWHKQLIRNKMYTELKQKRIKLEHVKFQKESLQQVQHEQHEALQALCRR